MAKPKIVSVIGARPHFIKAFPLFQAMSHLRDEHTIVHTGQHYDDNMSKLFFDQFGMPSPDINLNIGSGTHAEQTAGVMIGVEKIVLEKKPDFVIVFGDTNSTLAATIAGAKYYYPVVHIEAGVRCFNWRMPEEINRTLIDHASDFLICPSDAAVRNLQSEGITKGVMSLGDVMYDTFEWCRNLVQGRHDMLDMLGIEPGRYVLSTLHREATTDSPEKLLAILRAFETLGEPVVLPVHPRTHKLLQKLDYKPSAGGQLKLIEPVGYLEMLQLLLNARKVATDSGGVQKEAYWAGKGCVTMMEETTWTETVDQGWNVLVGLDPEKLREELKRDHPSQSRPDIYGAPGAAERVVAALGWN